MHFCHLRNAHDDPVLILDGTPIPVVEENKFLGVVFDRKLSLFLTSNSYKRNVKKRRTYYELLPILTGELIVKFY